MAEERDAPIDARQREGGIDHAADFVNKELRRAIDARNVAGHGDGITSMPLEIEGNRDIARSRQRQGIGFHELSRAGEAVCDDDGGSFRAVCALVDGRWRRADRELCDRKAGPFTFELPSPGPDAQNAESDGYPSGDNVA
jgi:hypothetical protein